MGTKTQAERDVLNTRLRIEAARDRVAKVAIFNEWATACLGREVPSDLLHAFGHSEWSRGWGEGVSDATDN